ncbi:MAG: potassium channel protein [Candidatus Saganbacteria bacterium]|nr:potassium channel protein [Candidatus Saganbacteria bacterium]
MNPFKRLMLPFLILLVIVLLGVIGYEVIEGWSVFDSLYMLVITLFTVGFHEVHELSAAGRVLTMVIIISGVGTAIYTVGLFGEMIIEGQIFGYRRRKRMEHKIKDMKEHYIICGFGRVGHQVAAEFAAAKLPYVVIDIKPETADELEQTGIPYIIGDTTTDGKLEEAGVQRARGLVACADSDMENVFVTLSGRAANPDLYIVARASGKDAEEKLKLAGANRVISPYFISGRRMAGLIMRPVASDFLDTVMHGEHLEFSLREIAIPEKSKLIGKSLEEASIRQKSGATVLAIRKADGGFNLQPLAVSTIEGGDILIVIGTQEQLELLSRMIK